MGCAQSKIDNEESVARCKERRQFMKEAVASRNAFAAAHSSYIMSLKNTGAALSEYGQAEMVAFLHHNSAVPTTNATSASVPATVAQTHTIDNLPPPPPPLPDFSPSPLRRAATMPVIPPFSTPGNPSGISENANPSVVTPIPVEEVRGRGRGSREENIEEKVEQQTPPPPPPPENKGMTWDYFFSMEESIAVPSMVEEDSIAVPSMVEEDIHQDVEDAIEVDEVTPPVTPQKVVIETPPPPLPPLSVPVPGNIARNVKQDMPTGTHHQHAASTGVLETKRGKSVTAADVANGLNLVQILTELDDHFLKGSESAQEVSKMLEATKLHYHSNFADNRGHIDHSARVMRVITWNKSFKGLPNGENGSDDFDNDEWETHATILDKLLAWEKKLYDEVKAGELMKIEYQRKVALLNRQKKRGVNPEALEKTKAAVSHLHTRYIVDMQSMDSTVSEIQHLRDNQLYPKLSALVDGMAQMWEALYAHHGSQLKMVIDLRALDISSTPVETSEQHYERTAQLYRMANEWHSNFQKLVNHQKEYIQALNSWLKLNIIPIESSLKEKVSSPPRVVQPPIQSLLHVWHDQLEKLHDDLAKSAIHSFAAVINAIMLHQQEELKQKEKCEEIKKEYVRKERAFTDWYNKYINRKTPSDEADEEQNDTTTQKDPVAERRFVVESLHKRVEEEEDNYLNLCKQVREKSVTSLKTHLPELFRALSDFSLACSNMYKNLKAITRAQSNGHP